MPFLTMRDHFEHYRNCPSNIQRAYPVLWKWFDEKTEHYEAGRDYPLNGDKLWTFMDWILRMEVDDKMDAGLSEIDIINLDEL